MANQANTWGWRALAAKLLLAPLVAAGVAAPAFAQMGAPGRTPVAAPAAAKPAAAAATTTTTDPKELLKLGRAALAEGNLDAAQDYAHKAAAGNPGDKWGLFADTPDALLKDCAATKAKFDKTYAADMTKEAKDFLARAKAARTDADKAVALQEASVRIDRAVALAGPGGWADDLNPFADKPEAVKKEIDAARALLPKAKPQATATAAPPSTTGVVRADVRGTTPAAKPARAAAVDLEQTAPAGGGTASAGKTAAVKLMADGRALMAEGKLADARAKFVLAKKSGVSFSITEENPDSCLQELTAIARDKVDGLVAAARKHTDKKDYAKAEAGLTAAREVAVSLDLWVRGIDLELDAIHKASGAVEKDVVQVGAAVVADLPEIDVPAAPPKKKGGAPLPDVPSLDLPTLDEPKAPVAKETVKPTVLPPAVKPTVDVDLPALPGADLPPVIKPEPKKDKFAAKPEGKKDEPKKDEPKAEKDTGLKLLDQAAVEMKRGKLDDAARLAAEAHNGEYGPTVKADAQKLLVLIDGERMAAKKAEAADSLAAASGEFNAKQFQRADRILSLIDPMLLSEEKRKQYDAMTKATAAEMAKLAAPPVEAPGVAKVGDAAKAGGEPQGGLIPSTPTAPPAGGSIEAVKKAKDAEMMALRQEGLQAEDAGRKAFDRGETDLGIQLLSDFAIKVRASKLTAQQQQLLLNPIERRLDGFRIQKKQMDFLVKEAKDKKEWTEGRLAANESARLKGEEIGKRVQKVKHLMEEHKYAEAEALALQTKQLDPDDEKLNLVYLLARNNRRSDDYAKIKDRKEELFRIGMNDAENPGQVVTSDDPVKAKLEASRRAQLRGGDDFFYRARTPVEREIEMRLEKPLTVEFTKAPLREVLKKFSETAQLNITTDEPALDAEGTSIDALMVTETITQPISLRNVMQVILSKYRLQFVVENDVVRVTTLKKAQGRLYTKVFSVMDLVTPIPDFALPEHASLDKAIAGVTNRQQNPGWMAQGQQQLGGGATSLTGGQPTSTWSPGGGLPNTPGVLNNVGQPGGPQVSPLATSATLAPSKQNHSEQLKKLITGMVRSNTWADAGGPGNLTYYDIGGALVVNQTADVISEVQQLLESLRRLQDLSVSVEVRIVSLSESYFERLGVDFALNFKTNPSPTFEQQLTTGQFRADPFINDIRNTNQVVGYNPAAGGFTSDLGVPVRPNSYGFSVPPFGGYPGNGFGGLNLGLAFLNDIQVFMFLEASAGDRRINVMQAPKLTQFNGQTSTVTVNDLAFFTLGLQVFNANGQFVYIPQNTGIPIGQSNGQSGVSVTIQTVVTADRRFVRMTMAPQLSALTSANVPLFPVTAFITPVFEGGSQGQPIPFTQFFQQPTLSSISIQTTVAVPDGGTVLLGGLKTMSEGRTEAGPPILSNIPYLSRLFRNTGVGRESRHIMIMVTPRIIITSEEEENQTGSVSGVAPR